MAVKSTTATPFCANTSLIYFSVVNWRVAIKIIIINSIMYYNNQWLLKKLCYSKVKLNQYKLSTFDVVVISKLLLRLKLILQAWLILHHYLVSLKIYLFFVMCLPRFNSLFPSISLSPTPFLCLTIFVCLFIYLCFE